MEFTSQKNIHIIPDLKGNHLYLELIPDVFGKIDATIATIVQLKASS